MSLVYTTDTTSPCPTWTKVPASAYGGTYGGTVEARYPESNTRDGNGQMCGAVGRAWVILQSEVMTASGMNFWQDLFSSTAANYATIRLSAFDGRRNWWGFYIGHLKRPKWDRIAWSSGSHNSLYYRTEIELGECVTSPNTRFWTTGKSHVGDLTDIVR